jgi:DNA-binding NarL/FixJ family response regulator
VTIRIVLVDDHPVVCAGVRALLDAEFDLEVVGEADSGGRAIDLARRLRPDVVIADFLLPDMDGITVTESLRCGLPETQVVILTSTPEEEFPIARAVRAGAAGYMSKNADVDLLVRTVRMVGAGQPVLSPRAAAHLVEQMQSATEQAALTTREREVLRELTIGRTNKEIARSLEIAVSTVKSHVRVILEKLSVQSRTQAALQALRSEMFSPDELATR